VGGIETEYIILPLLSSFSFSPPQMSEIESHLLLVHGASQIPACFGAGVLIGLIIYATTPDFTL
jgi:hypothetical protein